VSVCECVCVCVYMCDYVFMWVCVSECLCESVCMSVCVSLCMCECIEAFWSNMVLHFHGDPGNGSRMVLQHFCAHLQNCTASQTKGP
jgi:hypothetical protein